MKPKTTLFLLVVALIIGGIVALDYRKGVSTQERLAKGKRVLDFQAKDITGLKLDFTNAVYTLEKTGDVWQIKQPLSAKANYSTVSSILDELEFAERNRSMSGADLKGITPKDFGLDNPRVKLTLKGPKKPLVLLVGNETPTKDAMFAQVQGKKDVMVVPKAVYQRLNHTLDDLRDRTVLDFQPAMTTRLDVRGLDREIDLARSSNATNAEPRWALTHPLSARADLRKVSELLTALSGLQVMDFVSDDPKDTHTFLLDEPEREVTVWMGEVGKTLQIGRASTNDASKVYVKLKSSDSVYTVPAAAAQKFTVQANDLRDAQVLVFSDNDVHGIDVLRGSDRISLVRTDASWNITAPVALAADDNSVQQLLRHLGDLSAKQFTADVATDLDKYGLAAPVATVILRGSGTNPVVQLLVGGTDASNTVRYVKRVDEPFIYGVETNITDWLPTSPLTLRTHELAALKADDITKLTVEKGVDKVALERGADKKWKLMESAQGVIDNDALQRLLDALTVLQAEDFVREGRDGLAEYGLDHPEATLTATAGDKTYTFELGKAQGPEKRYAFWSDPPLVFTLWESRANALTGSIVMQPTPSPASSLATNTPVPATVSTSAAPAEAKP